MPQSTQRLLVLLRGINVGGHHSVPMADLRTLFAKLGCTQVATYIQSGNVVCTAPASLTAPEIAFTLESRFGFPIPVALRTGEELAAIIAANPFPASNADEATGSNPSIDPLHAVFFETTPPPPILHMLEAKRTGGEQLALHNRELYLHLPQGAGRSKLALACTAPTTPGNPTMRNWKTILQLHTLLGA